MGTMMESFTRPGLPGSRFRRTLTLMAASAAAVVVGLAVAAFASAGT